MHPTLQTHWLGCFVIRASTETFTRGTCSYWKGNWSSIDWAVAQLGTMFPENRVRKPLADRFATCVATPGENLALKALAAQRLASKDPNLYRAALRAGVKASVEPMERRVLVLASLACGEERKFLRSSLGDFKENQVLLELLEDRNFVPVPVAKDFSGVE